MSEVIRRVLYDKLLLRKLKVCVLCKLEVMFGTSETEKNSHF
jgi:hypothetical protein